MKAYRLLSVGAIALCLAGCSTFFDNSAPSALTAENIYASPAMTQQAVTAVYELFGEERFFRNRLACGYAGLNTDIEYNRKSGNEYATYRITPANSDLSSSKGADPWSNFNAMIERCNNIVDGIDRYGLSQALSAEDKATFEYMKGEALFLRAFAMLEMVKYWGDVPVNVASYNGESIESVTQEKKDRNVAFEQIRKDLKAAANLLSWAGQNQGAVIVNDVRRPSKGAALALLARADLMYAGKAVRPNSLHDAAGYSITWNVEQDKRIELYQEVMTACNEVISKESAKLLDDYEQVFKDICQDKVTYTDMEHMWVIPFADGSRGQVMNYNCLKFNSTSAGNMTFGILKNNVNYDPGNVSSNAVLSIVPTLLWDFELGDKRKLVSILPYSWKLAQAKKINSLTSKDTVLYPAPQANVDQWYSGKYRLEWMNRKNLGTDDGIDFPIIRYADVLLMYAEAAIGSNDEIAVPAPGAMTITPQEAFDKVRARAGLASKPLTLANIQDERKFEFSGEYIRKYDLMRWGILREKMIETRERLDQFRTKYNLNGVYLTYEPDDSMVESGAVAGDGKPIHGYKVIDIWVYGGPGTKPTTGMFASSDMKMSEKLARNAYVMYDYDKPEQLESRQYWPVFSTNIGTSNGLLWNNYGY